MTNIISDATMIDEARDLLLHGISITKDGKRIDPSEFYVQPEDETMIERVARAMWEYSVRESPFLNGDPMDGWSAVARAALEALREPTPEMIDIGKDAASTVPIPNTAAIIWKAMIDSALTETPA